jgi:hypothetical protein
MPRAHSLCVHRELDTREIFSDGTDRKRRLASLFLSKDYSDKLRSTKTSTNLRPAQDYTRVSQAQSHSSTCGPID